MPQPHALIDFGDPHTPGAEPLRLAFGKPDQVLVAHAVDEVAAVLAQVDALSRQGHWCVGYVRYEAAPAFDVALHVHAADGPLAWFGVHAQPLQAFSAEDATEPTVTWNAGVERAVFDQNMAEIHRAIAAGELYQVNYTAPLQAQFAGSALAYFGALRRAQPRAYSAFIDAGAEQVLSVSPELFFDWDGERILSRPMKGTAARGATPVDDAANATQLRRNFAGDPKLHVPEVHWELTRDNVMVMERIHGVPIGDLARLRELGTDFRVLAENGVWIFSSYETVPPVNNADRPYFQYHRDNNDSAVRISGPLLSRATGRPTLLIHHGQIEHRHLRRELMTVRELKTIMEGQGS